MSDRTEGIRAAITTDWKSTREILEDAGYQWDYQNQKCALRVLNSLVKYGLVEKRKADYVESGVHPKLWRRCRA